MSEMEGRKCFGIAGGEFFFYFVERSQNITFQFKNSFLIFIDIVKYYNYDIKLPCHN